MLDNYHAAEEVAKKFKVSLMTLALWRSRKQGPNYFKIGRRVFYHEDDLVDFINKKRLKEEARRSQRIND